MNFKMKNNTISKNKRNPKKVKLGKAPNYIEHKTPLKNIYAFNSPILKEHKNSKKLCKIK